MDAEAVAWDLPNTPAPPGQLSLTAKVNTLRTQNLRLWVPVILLAVYVGVAVIVAMI